MYGENADATALLGGGKPSPVAQVDKVTLDSVLNQEAGAMVEASVAMDMLGAISALMPDSEATLFDVTMDFVGYDVEEEDGAEVTADNIKFDEDAMVYATAITLDHLAQLGMSSSGLEDLVSEDSVIASEALQDAMALLNDVTEDGMAIPQIVALTAHQEAFSEALGEDVTLDSAAGQDLSDVTLDWSFSPKGNPKKRKGAGHKIKIVDCVRTIDGKRKHGRCGYPVSLLNGKYKKKGASADQKVHLSLLKQSPRDAQWRSRISKTMKEKHKASAKSSKKA